MASEESGIGHASAGQAARGSTARRGTVFSRLNGPSAPPDSRHTTAGASSAATPASAAPRRFSVAQQSARDKARHEQAAELDTASAGEAESAVSTPSTAPGSHQSSSTSPHLTHPVRLAARLGERMPMRSLSASPAPSPPLSQSQQRHIVPPPAVPRRVSASSGSGSHATATAATAAVSAHVQPPARLVTRLGSTSGAASGGRTSLKSAAATAAEARAGKAAAAAAAGLGAESGASAVGAAYPQGASLLAGRMTRASPSPSPPSPATPSPSPSPSITLPAAENTTALGAKTTDRLAGRLGRSGESSAAELRQPFDADVLRSSPKMFAASAVRPATNAARYPRLSGRLGMPTDEAAITRTVLPPTASENDPGSRQTDHALDRATGSNDAVRGYAVANGSSANGIASNSVSSSKPAVALSSASDVVNDSGTSHAGGVFAERSTSKDSSYVPSRNGSGQHEPSAHPSGHSPCTLDERQEPEHTFGKGPVAVDRRHVTQNGHGDHCVDHTDNHAADKGESADGDANSESFLEESLAQGSYPSAGDHVVGCPRSETQAQNGMGDQPLARPASGERIPGYRWRPRAASQTNHSAASRRSPPHRQAPVQKPDTGRGSPEASAQSSAPSPSPSSPRLSPSTPSSDPSTPPSSPPADDALPAGEATTAATEAVLSSHEHAYQQYADAYPPTHSMQHPYPATEFSSYEMQQQLAMSLYAREAGRRAIEAARMHALQMPPSVMHTARKKQLPATRRLSTPQAQPVSTIARAAAKKHVPAKLPSAGKGVFRSTMLPVDEPQAVLTSSSDQPPQVTESATVLVVADTAEAVELSGPTQARQQVDVQAPAATTADALSSSAGSKKRSRWSDAPAKTCPTVSTGSTQAKQQQPVVASSRWGPPAGALHVSTSSMSADVVARNDMGNAHGERSASESAKASSEQRQLPLAEVSPTAMPLTSAVKLANSSAAREPFCASATLTPLATTERPSDQLLSRQSSGPGAAVSGHAQQTSSAAAVFPSHEAHEPRRSSASRDDASQAAPARPAASQAARGKSAGSSSAEGTAVVSAGQAVNQAATVRDGPQRLPPTDPRRPPSSATLTAVETRPSSAQSELVSEGSDAAAPLSKRAKRRIAKRLSEKRRVADTEVEQSIDDVVVLLAREPFQHVVFSPTLQSLLDDARAAQDPQFAATPEIQMSVTPVESQVRRRRSSAGSERGMAPQETSWLGSLCRTSVVFRLNKASWDTD